MLKWTGNLRRQGGVLTVCSDRFSAIFGKCLIVTMGAEFAILLLGDVPRHALTLVQVAMLYGAAAFVIALVWRVHLTYVRPWTIRRRLPTNDHRIESDVGTAGGS